MCYPVKCALVLPSIHTSLLVIKLFSTVERVVPIRSVRNRFSVINRTAALPHILPAITMFVFYSIVPLDSPIIIHDELSAHVGERISSLARYLDALESTSQLDRTDTVQTVHH